jgi:methionyl-tRNA formyltransferase|tara:strand:- start:1453 stop:2349 length:897 start_codon:yes stop_codon:yes gene_type:complete
MSGFLPNPPLHPKRIVFFGTPEDAVPVLRELNISGIDIPLVVTRPERRRGRRELPSVSAVAKAAAELEIEVSTEIGDALQVGADCGVVVAYGKLIPKAVLEQLPMVNLHFSILPRWRGAAPVERAIIAGDLQTGICVMGLEEGLDTGPIYRMSETPIGEKETAVSLRKRLSALGSKELIAAFKLGLTNPTPQSGQINYAEKIQRADLELKWTAPAEDLDRIIRVGGAWTTFRGHVLKIHEAQVETVSDLQQGMVRRDSVGTATCNLKYLVVQPEGKSPVAAKDWLNGARLADEEMFGV